MELTDYGIVRVDGMTVVNRAAEDLVATVERLRRIAFVPSTLCTDSLEDCPDEGDGMLLADLLDQSTLDWLEKVKGQ